MHVVLVHMTRTFTRGVNIKFKYFNSLPKTEQQTDPKTAVHHRVSGGISIFYGQYGNIKLCRAWDGKKMSCSVTKLDIREQK